MASGQETEAADDALDRCHDKLVQACTLAALRSLPWSRFAFLF